MADAPLLWFALGIACRSHPPPDTLAAGCPCDAIDVPDAPVSDAEGLAALLASAQAVAFDSLVGVSIGSLQVDDVAYFRAWPEIDTMLLDDGAARDYTIHFDPVVLEDPMPPAALAAVLVHELGHVDDYVGMTGEELVNFGVWYGTQDPLTSDELAAYERGTDEKALERGCAEGLAEAHEWIYAHASPELLPMKERNYLSPEEIDAWTEAYGDCPSRSHLFAEGTRSPF
jgi:hypothetical protein